MDSVAKKVPDGASSSLSGCQPESIGSTGAGHFQGRQALRHRAHPERMG